VNNQDDKPIRTWHIS